MGVGVGVGVGARFDPAEIERQSGELNLIRFLKESGGILF